MAVLISGKLIGPNGDPRSGVTIMLTAVKTSSAVVHLAPSSSTTGPEAFVPSKPGGHQNPNGSRWLGQQIGKVLHHIADRRQDGYVLQKNFGRNMLKVVYGGSGVVVQASDDASTLWPVGASVAEIPTEQIPKGFSLPLRGGVTGNTTVSASCHGSIRQRSSKRGRSRKNRR
ncbi:Prophage tail fibre N-terminal [Serratia odorifera]|uniref:Prophage tail fibre N-terminal n=1 Tax=Serratia odorifera TaxID=618 RepID=A0A447KQL7_SEROD|nr:hypothetical protein CEQ31_016470 [Serratia odorifera]VDZ56750.1 Prophage tail fibre N-terminal [Serratia odorifera]